MDSSRFMTRSLRALPWGEHVCQILAAAIQAVEPGEAINRHMFREGETLTVSGQAYHLPDYEQIILVGIGKAAAPMSMAAAKLLKGYLTRGVLITKDGYESDPGQREPYGLEVYVASHPIPDERGQNATQQTIRLLSETGKNDLVVCVISGGGSALLTYPAEGISLQDLQALTNLLLRCGASIGEINTLRKHLDQVKGGGLRRIAPAPAVISLILSDVVGDALDQIASGPWVPDPSTFLDAYAILEKYNLTKAAPSAILNHLQHGVTGEIRDTPKPGDPIFDRSQNIIVGSGAQAAHAAMETAKSLGWSCWPLTTSLQGEARQAGQMITSFARLVDSQGRPAQRPACIIAAGETTVTVTGNGIGGRNQELALSTVSELANIPASVLVALATDGGDGPTPAAGAVVTSQTLSEATRMGMEPEDFLARNDAFHFFEPLGDLLITGPTQTNVNDLVLLFLGNV